MKQKITASEPLKTMQLEVDDTGIAYSESAVIGMGTPSHHFFSEIDAVVRNTAEPVLSIQVGTTIYKIRYKANNEEHDGIIERIVAAARATV